MWAVYGLLALLGLVVLLLLALLFIPVTGRMAYDGEFTARIRVLGIPIRLAPRPEKQPKKPKKKGQKAKNTKRSTRSKLREIQSLLKADGVGSTLRFLKDVAVLAGRTIGKALGAVTVKQMQLYLVISTEDAATTALRYGQVCSVLYPTLAAIEQKVCVQQRQVQVEPNFLLERSMVRFDVRFRISVWRLLGAGFTLLWGFITLREKDKPEKSKEVM